MTRPNLSRFLRPRSIAIVGTLDRNRNADIIKLLERPDIDIFLINKREGVQFGRETYPTLAAIGQPVDAVFCLVNAKQTVEVVEQARLNGAGGVVVIAGGFREDGEEGATLEAALLVAAGEELALMGPNCFGFADFSSGIDLWLGGINPANRTRGSIGLISHTGGMIPAVVIAGKDRNLGLSYGISVGNEANTDIVDYMEHLIDDPNTRVIALIIESIRRPDAFFKAAERALRAGKPIVALKLGRSARTAALAKSHTGAMAGEAWAYDAAFKQYGIINARELVEFLDVLAGFEQIPSERWPKLRNFALVTPTGGGASLASDVFDAFNLTLPTLDSMLSAVREVIPTAVVLNPLDMTGFVFFAPHIAERIASLYAGSDEVDALIFQWHMQNEYVAVARPIIDLLARQCAAHGKTFILSAAEDGHIESDALAIAGEGTVLARGPVAAARALDAIAFYSDVRDRWTRASVASPSGVIPAPAESDVTMSVAGPMLSFDATMKLLSSAGIAVAPYWIVEAGQASIASPPGDRFVVKLADVPHRTDIGALRFNVAPDQLTVAVEELRDLARKHDAPQTVVIQEQLRFDSEAFIGLTTDNGLGPMVVCGLGGIFVEVLKKFCGLLAPFSYEDALAALRELDDTNVFEGLRGATAWDRDALASLMVAAGRLSKEGAGWIASLDINPLAVVDGCFVALDGLCLLSKNTLTEKNDTKNMVGHGVG